MTRNLLFLFARSRPPHLMFYFSLYLLPRLNPFLVLPSLPLLLMHFSRSFLPLLSLHSSLFFFLISSHLFSFSPYLPLLVHSSLFLSSLSFLLLFLLLLIFYLSLHSYHPFFFLSHKREFFLILSSFSKLICLFISTSVSSSSVYVFLCGFLLSFVVFILHLCIPFQFCFLNQTLILLLIQVRQF
jgi:hypothetical protein